MGPINGAQVIIRIDDDSVGPLDVAFQKDVSFDTNNALIDISNKTSGRRSLYLLGRLDQEMSLDMFFSDEQSYLLLKAKADNGRVITVIRALDDGGDGVYTNIEQADAVITKMSEKFPDQEGAMASLTFKISGAWGPVAP
jgi:hypothetical protein